MSTTNPTPDTGINQQQQQPTGATAAETDPSAVQAAVRMVQLAADMELSRIEMAEKRRAFIALLPIATPEQFLEVKKAAANESELPEGYRVNADFRLSAEQEAILKDVRKTRREELMGRKDAILATTLADKENKLVSMKVRVGSKKTTTTMRFEKSTVARKGLLETMRKLAEKA